MLEAEKLIPEKVTLGKITKFALGMRIPCAKSELYSWGPYRVQRHIYKIILF